jgi:hypothetical protein
MNVEIGTETPIFLSVFCLCIVLLKPGTYFPNFKDNLRNKLSKADMRLIWGFAHMEQVGQT